jgi:hypothetical protein
VDPAHTPHSDVDTTACFSHLRDRTTREVSKTPFSKNALVEENLGLLEFAGDYFSSFLRDSKRW